MTVFGHKTDAPTQDLDGGTTADALTVQYHFALSNLAQAGNRLRQFSLSITFHTCNSQNLARLQREIQAAQSIQKRSD